MKGHNPELLTLAEVPAQQPRCIHHRCGPREVLARSTWEGRTRAAEVFCPAGGPSPSNRRRFAVRFGRGWAARKSDRPPRGSHSGWVLALAVVTGLVLTTAVFASAPGLIRNGGFEEGEGEPAGWRLQDTQGAWATEGRAGRSITVEGNGRDAGAWREVTASTKPGSFYQLRFWGRREVGATGGTGVSGPSRVNRDFPMDADWREYGFAFRTPDAGEDFVRLGQWEVKGRLWFDDVSLVPVWPVHAVGDGGPTLGEGESVEKGVYRFRPDYGWRGANVHRPLVSFTAGFNSGRWLFPGGAELIYRFALESRPDSTVGRLDHGSWFPLSPSLSPAVRGGEGVTDLSNAERRLSPAPHGGEGLMGLSNAERRISPAPPGGIGADGQRAAQSNGRIHLGILNYIAGTLVVEAGRDGKAWTVLGQLDRQRMSGDFEVPPDWFPAPEVFVRLRQGQSDGNLQMQEFRFEAALSGPVAEAGGATQFLEALREDPALVVRPGRFLIPDDRGQCRLELLVTNIGSTSLEVRGELGQNAQSGRAATRVRVLPGEGAVVAVTSAMPGPGLHRLPVRLTAGRRVVFEGAVEVQSNFLVDSSYGTRLRGRDGLDLWWCESGWKVGRERGLPRASAVRPVSLSAAQGEDEAVQVVLRPERTMELRSVVVRQASPSGALPLEVSVGEVAYVHVTQPTDGSCQRGWYPDPLPPWRGPLRLESGRNQTLWINFRIPRGARAGWHRGELVLETSVGEVRVPWRVQVYDFELPRETHLRSALGLGAGAINQYHGLEAQSSKLKAQAGDPASRSSEARSSLPKAQRSVFDLYLRNFAEHRISPYSFFDYDPIDVKFVGEGADKRARVDFARFDAAAAKWIDEARFNTFSLPLHGMGGGTFHSRSLGKLEGFEEGTPEHARLFQDYLSQVEAHLREKGWLDEAFCYWFDEPDPKDYEFVVAGMKRIKAAAPGLRRMLTEQPEPSLIGHVDIWCGLTPEWTPERVRARREAGEEVWWYICTGPKAPFVTEFIDHPGTELRLWPWQSWQYGISGILIWATIYWNSPAAFVAPKLQDPWTDPMSYVSGYDNPPGFIGLWGNGDGRFLYPPRRDPNQPQEPCFDAPINSVRWENLRDGMEDYEYLWLLEQEIKRLEALGQESVEPVPTARALLTVPAELSKNLTTFTTDPRVILAHREKVARMIERLRAGRR